MSKVTTDNIKTCLNAIREIIYEKNEKLESIKELVFRPDIDDDHWIVSNIRLILIGDQDEM